MFERLPLIFLLMSSMALADTTAIIKGPLDHKEYRYLELNNTMKVLLISDADADKSAAALDVYVGSGSDSDNWEGLAHFLEHMLFLGTEKYPEAGEFQSFINIHGGAYNAYTSFDHTNYYFSISPDYFESGLDRFSRFFIDPTFDEIYVDRERSIVHSEYQARKKNEFRRIWETQKNWLNPQHPASRFSIGSLETLADRNEINVRQQLIDFYKNHYSANIMTLVVVGKESLAQLQQWVEQKFSPVKNMNYSVQSFDQPYLNQDLIPAKLDIIPEKEKYELGFSFPVPSTLEEYNSKPLSYIANLLGHEGSGSLLSILKKRGWADSLSAGPGYVDRIQGTFNVGIGLTREGLQHVEDIGELLFQTINLIREDGVEEWRFHEQARLAEISFRFNQEHDAGRLAQILASRLQLYPARQILSAPYLMSHYDPHRIRELLGYLRPDNVNIRVVAPDLDTDQITSYFDVKYRLSGINPSIIKRWKSTRKSPRLSLPGANPFIPDRFELLDDNKATAIPVKLETDNDITLWYQQDEEFKHPRANLFINIMSPEANHSPGHAVLTSLYVRFVKHQLSDLSYDAYLAGLNYEIYRHVRGISIRISGYEDRQSELLKLILHALSEPDLNQRRLDIISQSMERELKNRALDSPSEQTTYEIYRQLIQPYWSEQQRLEALKEVSVEAIEAFIKRFYAHVNVVVLSHGAVSRDISLQRVGLLSSLFENSEFIQSVDKPTVKLLADGANLLYSLDIDHSDAALVLYFQGKEQSWIEWGKMALLNKMLNSRFNNQLRTENRVGYLVYAGNLNIDRMPGLVLSVQSPSHSPRQINELYTEFIFSYANELEGLAEEEFADAKTGVTEEILRKPKKLSDRTNRYWREIDLQEFDFNIRKNLVKIISNLSLDEMRLFFHQRMVQSARKLTIQAIGTTLGGPISDQGHQPVDSVLDL